MTQNYFLRFFSLLSLIIFINSLQAAYLKFIPQTIFQPDGTKIECYASGDEFYNWLHDENGYTIIQSQVDGYFYYADFINNKVVPSSYKVHETNPENEGLLPWIKATEKEYFKKVNSFQSSVKSKDAPTSGAVNTLSIYIRFNDDEELERPRSFYEAKFNAEGASSLRDYYIEVSYETLFVYTYHYPESDMEANVSYQDPFPRAYYQPYNAVTNPDGYSNDDERRFREHNLLKSAIEFVESQIPDTLNFDADNDGYIDNVSFIIKGSPGAWASLLWPHRWSLWSVDAFIHGKQVYDYLFMLESGFQTGTLCHEFFHVLGAPDLYHYTGNGIDPVGGWDIMESNSDPPQYMGAFMKYKYGDWIDEIPVITEEGTYTLNPLQETENTIYRINSPNSTTEYFVVEYRRKEGRYDSNTPGSRNGLLVYRINTLAGNGNAGGPPDEVYLYRPNGSLTSNGNLSSAPFSADYGNIEISDATNPSPFLSNGEPGGLHLNNIGSSGETISFELTFSPAEYPDLMVTDIDASTIEVSPGDELNFTANIVNLGEGSAVPSLVRCYLSEDSIYDILDKNLNISIMVDALPGASSASIEETARIPSNTGFGDHYLLIIADFFESISETDENNNTGYFEITVAEETGINGESQDANIMVFPNPAQDFLNIEFQANRNTTIELRNMIGKLVYADRIQTDSNFNTSVKTNRFSPGIYFLIIKDDHQQQTIKILMQ